MILQKGIFYGWFLKIIKHTDTCMHLKISDLKDNKLTPFLLFYLKLCNVSQTDQSMAILVIIIPPRLQNQAL